MNLYINGSNRNENCYQILSDLKEKEDVLFSLSDKSINYCLGCGACSDHLEDFCVIDDDMRELYHYMVETNKIIIATPIYMNHITGILKNVIDRWNPYDSHSELLKGKTIYLITVGQISEEENEEVAENIKKYFESIGGFMGFKTVFLRNFSSGDADKVVEEYANYEKIIDELKEKIEN